MWFSQPKWSLLIPIMSSAAVCAAQSSWSHSSSAENVAETPATLDPELASVSAPLNPIFVSDFSQDKVYAFSSSGPFPQAPGSALVTGFSAPYSIAISNDGATAFVADLGLSSVDSFPTAGSFPVAAQHIVHSAIGQPTGLALTPDGSTVFFSCPTEGVIASFPTAGPFPMTISTPAVTGINCPDAITISNDGIAYVSTASGYVYSFSTASPPLTIGSPIVSGFPSHGCGGPLTGPLGIAVSKDGGTVFVSDVVDGNVYAFSAISPPSVIDSSYIIVHGLNQPANIAISEDGSLAYVADETGNVWAFPTISPYAPVTLLATGFTFPIGIASIGHPLIDTTDLSGNNLRLAEYLNANAPASVIYLFSPLQGSELKDALENTAPTRNAFSTFVSQTMQISLSRLVNDRLVQQRRRQHQKENAQIAKLETAEDFLADNEEIAFGRNQKKINNQKKSPGCCENNPVSLWAGAFGEYASVKPKHQSPDFNTGSGGFVVASDYRGVYPHPIGGGVAYAHTHIHEDEDAGHADIDQGDVFIYGTFPVANWYFDTAIWGGYYHSKNVREISFTDFWEGEAKCKIHGWQLSPHFECGYDYWMNWLGLEPFIMADYVGCWERKARESGSTTLNFGQKSRYCSLVRGETGLRLQEVLTCNFGTITFMEKAGYAYQKAFHTGRINAFLIGSPGSFTVTTLTTAQNMGVGEIEALIEPTNKSCYASFGFHTEIGSKYQSYQGSLEIGKDF